MLDIDGRSGMDIGFVYALRRNFSLDIAPGKATLNIWSNKFGFCGMSLRFPKTQYVRNTVFNKRFWASVAERRQLFYKRQHCSIYDRHLSALLSNFGRIISINNASNIRQCMNPFWRAIKVKQRQTKWTLLTLSLMP
jgi:hypothetical protein